MDEYSGAVRRPLAIPGVDTYSPFIEEFNREQERGSERGVVLVCSSMAEELLRRVLIEFMADGADERSLFEGPAAPLQGLSARTKLAFAMGLVSSRQVVWLDLLRSIRNKFAHQLRASLSAPDISDALQQRVTELLPQGATENASGSLYRPRYHLALFDRGPLNAVGEGTEAHRNSSSLLSSLVWRQCHSDQGAVVVCACP